MPVPRSLSVIALLLLCPAPGLAQDTAKAVPVVAVAAEQRALSEYVFGEGTARAVRREFLLFETDGKVDFVWQSSEGAPLKEGDKVTGPAGDTPGQLLARLDQRLHLAERDKSTAELDQARRRLASAEAQIAAAEAEFDAARADLNRAETLVKKGIATQARLDEAKARFRTARAQVASNRAQADAVRSDIIGAEARLRQAGLALDQTEIRAPFDGTVAYINVRPGDLVSRANVDTSTETRANKTVPIVLIDDRAYEITLQLPVFDGLRARVGQRAWIVTGQSLATIQRDGYKAVDLTKGFIPARVFSVSPSISPGNRSIRVKLRTDGDTRTLSDGSFASVWIEVAKRDEAVVVPYNSVIFRGGEAHAFVVADDSAHAEKRDLKVGLWGIDGIEIVDGLKPLERVVTKGRGRLADGQAVRIVTPGEAAR